jgi:hypothetical protein
MKTLSTKKRPTKRAPDVWDSAAFSSIFLASSFPCSQTESTPRIVQKPQPTEDRAKKVANRPRLNPRMVFENGELWEFNWKRMLRLAMRRAKTQKMVFL